MTNRVLRSPGPEKRSAKVGFDKVRYRGIAKNHHRLCANFALVNLYMHRKRLVVLGQ